MKYGNKFKKLRGVLRRLMPLVGTLTWIKPKECDRIKFWISDEWCFVNRFGVRERGWRFFGFEFSDWKDEWAEESPNK